MGYPHPSHSHTHAGSPLGAGHCLGSQARSGHSQGHGCGADSAGSVHCGGHRRLDHGINIVVALAGLAQTPSGVISWPRVPKVAQGAAVTAGAWSGLGYVWVASVVFRYLWGLWVPLNQPKGLRSSQEGRGHNSYIMTHLLGLQVPLLSFLKNGNFLRRGVRPAAQTHR